MAMRSHPRRRFLRLHLFCQLVGQSENKKNTYLVTQIFPPEEQTNLQNLEHIHNPQHTQIFFIPSKTLTGI